MGWLRWIVAVVLPATLYAFGNLLNLYGSTLQPSGKWILIGSTVLGLAVYGIAEYQRPRTLKNAEALVTLLMEKALAEYRAIANLGPGKCTLRMSIMRYHRRWPEPWRKTLAVDYPLGDFSAAERELRFRRNAGACGMAMAQNDVIWYDRETAHEALKDMSALQREATEDLESILCIPIYRPDDEEQKRPIGVLAMDSTSGILRTKFNDGSIHGKLATYASMIGEVVP